MQCTWVNNNDMLSAVLKVLEVAKSVERTLNKMEEPLFRFIYNDNFASIVKRCALQKKKLNVFADYETLKKEMFGAEASFIGDIILPENCHLIRNRKILNEEGFIMNHCIQSFAEAFFSKEIFIIRMKEPEMVTFLIDDFHDTDYFCIREAKGINNTKPGRIPLEIMGKYIALEQKQAFFRENHFKDSGLEALLEIL